MTLLKRTSLLLTAVLAVQVGSARAAEPVGVVSHLNVVSDKSQDVSSLEAWKKTYIKDGMSDQDKAIAIFNTLVRYRHQANPPKEYLSSALAGGHVHDPLKTINVYGYGQCCCESSEVVGLARYLGFQARGRDITSHSVPEIFYGDAWHLVDASVMNYHCKADGSLASVDEIHEAVSSWLKDHPDLAGDDKKLRAFAKNGGWKNGPELLSKSDAFYGKDGVNTAGVHGWPSTMQEYSKVMGPTEFCVVMGYQVNVQLRPGEQITRNFFSRGIDFTNDMSKSYYTELQTRKSLGIQTKLGDVAPGRVGDGTITWNVPLKPDALKAVALSTENIAAAGAGIGAADASKPASFVLRLPSSYVYIKGNATLKANVGDGGGIAVSLSDNNGLDWKEVAKVDKTGEQTIDLSAFIKRRYDVRLKFDLTGQGTTIDSLATALDFQCSQAALPTLTEGENKITFNAGPQEGTVTIEGSTDTEAAKKNKQVTIADFHPKLDGFADNLQMSAGQGTATFDVAAPGDITRLRVSTVWRARDAKDGFELQASFDGGKTFAPVKDGTLAGATKGSSKYVVIDNVPAGTKAAQLRIAGKQSNTAVIFDLRIDADYKEPAGGFKPVQITYAWDENGTEKTDVHVAKTENDTYKIKCGAGAKVKSFAMRLAE